MFYFFIIKWAHVLMSLFHPTNTFYNIALFFFVSLCCFTDTILSPLSFLPSLTSLLHSLLLIAVFCVSSSISPSAPSLPSFPPYSIPLFPLRCTHLCDRLLLTHSTSASPQMRAERAKGREWCRAQRTGFNEASLNEFTAFHWTALSHVAD